VTQDRKRFPRNRVSNSRQPDPDPEFDLSDRPPTDEDYSVDATASDDFA
jgi:hypothetical protein